MTKKQCECFPSRREAEDNHLWLVCVRKGESNVVEHLEDGKTVFIELEKAVKYAHEHNMRVDKLTFKRISCEEVPYKHLCNGQYEINNCCTFDTTRDDGRTSWRRNPWYLTGD
jgi:hypothetical protein